MYTGLAAGAISSRRERKIRVKVRRAPRKAKERQMHKCGLHKFDKADGTLALRSSKFIPPVRAEGEGERFKRSGAKLEAGDENDKICHSRLPSPGRVIISQLAR